MKTTYRNRLLQVLAAAMLGLCIALPPDIAVGQAPAPSATPSSPSELLEQGIYNQDTKGDLDAAIAIYQQLITQARANDVLAAQAEFRLGQCQMQKGDKDAATQTFQKLISDYPGQTDLVAQAKVYVAPQRRLLPQPWVDGERLQMRMTAANGNDLGVVEYRSDFVQSGTDQIWRVGALTAAAGMTSVSSVDVEPTSFMPISSHWKHSMLGEVDAAYSPGQVELRRKGKDATVVKVTDPVIDNEESIDFARRLPLAPGYKVTVPIFSTLGGAEVETDANVPAIETVKVPAGTYQCWKLVLSTVNQTFWFSTDSNRYLVKFEAGPVTAELDSIAKRGPEVPVSFSDDSLGVSLTAPPQWVVFPFKNGQPAGQALIRTYDPNVDALDGGIRYFATGGLKPEEQASSQAWGDADLKAEQSELGTDVKVRPGGWTNYTVGGLPGVGAVIDSNMNGKHVTSFILWVIAPKNSERFALIAPADKFDGLMSQFQTILSSYQRE